MDENAAAALAEEREDVSTISDSSESEAEDKSGASTCATRNKTYPRRAGIEKFMQDNDLTPKNDITWRKNVTYQTPHVEWYQKRNEHLDQIESPLVIFSRYFTNEMFDDMSMYTNMYHIQNNTRFETTDSQEIKTFVGIHIIMGNLHYPRTRLYWNSKLFIPIISENMTFNRFSKLRTHIHFVDPNQVNNQDRFWKVRPLFDALKKRCSKLELETNLSVDEQIIPFKGQLNVKQYVKGKPCPCGIKLFALCGASGMLYDFILYQGATTELDPIYTGVFGQSAAIVATLANRITEPNHQLYFDNYFSNYQLLQWLQNNYIYATGTIRPDRFRKPPFSTENELKKKGRGSCEEFISGDGQVLLTRWYDNKVVNMGSNFQSIGEQDTCQRYDKKNKNYIDISRPECVREYNKSMGGVDKLDFLVSIYRTKIRSKKWTLRMFNHAIDLACTNAWAEYREQAERADILKRDIMDLLHFRFYVAEGLIVSGTTTIKKRGRPCSSPDSSPCSSRSTSVTRTPTINRRRVERQPIAEVRLDGVGHLPEFDDKPSHSQTRCKLPNCKGKTHIFCGKCRVHLCIRNQQNCFLLYHT